MVRPIAFGTVTRDALPDQIAQRLIALITEKHLKPGDRLPPERELSATMGVSRSSLREALRALAMLGVAEMRQGDGTYLTALDPETLMRPVGLVLALSGAGLTELFEARKLVEPGLAYLAAERIGDQAAEELQRCAEASADVLADADAFMWHDIELHALIATRGGQRDPVAPAGVGRVDGDRQPPADRPPGAGPPAAACATISRSPRRSRRMNRRRPRTPCCATWRTSNER